MAPRQKPITNSPHCYHYVPYRGGHLVGMVYPVYIQYPPLINYGSGHIDADNKYLGTSVTPCRSAFTT